MANQAVASIADVARASIQAYNDKNWDKFRSTSSPDLVYEELGTGRRIQGIDNTLEVFRGWANAFPDSKATFRNTYTDGNVVILELTWHGTHKGPLQTSKGNIAPTGKTFEVQACEIIEVSGDKAKKVRHYFDMNSLLKQIGV